MVHSTSFDVLVIVETFTSSLERIPLEEFRTSAAARATFLKALALAETHFADLVDEINMCQSDLKEINENGRTIRDLAVLWGCSVSLVSQVAMQLGITIDRFTRARLDPRGGQAPL